MCPRHFSFIHTHRFSRAPFGKSYFGRKGSIWKDFLLGEEVYNHVGPPHVSMLSTIFRHPPPVVILPTISVTTSPHCLIFMLCHFQIDKSHRSFLLLNNIQRIWSQPIPRQDGACHKRTYMEEKLAQSRVRLLITDYSWFLLFVAEIFRPPNIDYWTVVHRGKAGFGSCEPLVTFLSPN